jgi:hypothetical protein
MVRSASLSIASHAASTSKTASKNQPTNI